MANKREGFESVDVDGANYLFKSDFAFLAELKEEAGVDPMAVFSSFSAGECDPLLVRAVLASSFVSIEGAEPSETNSREIVEQLITLYGLQEAWILAQHMLSYSMIGSVKKSHLGSLEKITQALGGSRWVSSRGLLYRWALPLTIFGVSVCTSISLSALLFWQLME